MRKRTLALLMISLSAALLGACAATAPRKAMLTYQSVPDGAQIYEGDKSLGMVPVTRTYDSDGTSGSITTPDVRAVWPSGAQTTYFTILRSEQQSEINRASARCKQEQAQGTQGLSDDCK